MSYLSYHRVVLPLAALLALSSSLASAGTTRSAKPAVRRHARVRHRVRPVAHSAVLHPGTAAIVTTTVHRRTRRHIVFNPWTEPTYADSTVGDNVDGEDLVVRRAAVDALGPYNGAVVVTDPQTGRILSIVNQKLALKGAYQPCSTIKMVVSMASLSEGIVSAGSSIHITRRSAIDITRALAYSNNLFFAKLGEELGFERVEKYAKLFGLGEKAGLDIAGEEPGYLTDEPPQTGVGMMTSFGDGIRITPLELTSIVSTLANNGTMYYLQYPRNEQDVQKFVPRIKRELDIANFVPDVKPGMIGAVEYGTARRANYDPNDPVLGKTGTCTDSAQPGVHLGWFGSFNDVGNKKLAIVVLLTGGRGISGPIASGIGGAVYRNLSAQQYFGSQQQPIASSLITLHQ
jgi:penicillin-binding protein 2